MALHCRTVMLCRYSGFVQQRQVKVHLHYLENGAPLLALPQINLPLAGMDFPSEPTQLQINSNQCLGLLTRGAKAVGDQVTHNIIVCQCMTILMYSIVQSPVQLLFKKILHNICNSESKQEWLQTVLAQVFSYIYSPYFAISLASLNIHNHIYICI